jgi:hypothetical protein
MRVAGTLRIVKRTVSLAAMLGIVFASVRGRAENARRRPEAGISRADGRDVGFSLEIDLDCDPLPGPGKVLCVVRLRPLGGSLHWSDALVISAPPFATPLRDRVTDAKRNDDAGADLPLTLAATGDGEGELYVIGRATVCDERACRPVQAQASARIVVGGPSGAP